MSTGRYVRVEHLNLRLGTDLVFMPRLLDKLNNPSFINKVLTDKEQSLFESLSLERHKLEFLCGRFACKEAYAKAMGTGIGIVDFKDVEILKNEFGAPISNQGTFSISHDGDYAIAVVIIHE